MTQDGQVPCGLWSGPPVSPFCLRLASPALVLLFPPSSSLPPPLFFSLQHPSYSTASSLLRHLSIFSPSISPIMPRQFFVGGNFKMYGCPAIAPPIQRTSATPGYNNRHSGHQLTGIHSLQERCYGKYHLHRQQPQCRQPRLQS